jgi:hypothetical protein
MSMRCSMLLIGMRALMEAQLPNVTPAFGGSIRVRTAIVRSAFTTHA